MGFTSFSLMILDFNFLWLILLICSGTPGEVLSGIPLPDKKSLELILDKLQK